MRGSSMDYEQHIYKDPALPLIFHKNTRFSKLETSGYAWPHWHENLEILMVTEGIVSVLSGDKSIVAEPGEIVIINTNELHDMKSVSDICHYDCLIIDKNLCDEFDLDIEQLFFDVHIKDEIAALKYRNVRSALYGKGVLYKATVKAALLDFLVYVSRGYARMTVDGEQVGDVAKKKIVKKAINYIQMNFADDISTVDIAEQVGVSKYYFCRVFKDITGYSPIVFLNFVRCNNARNLMKNFAMSVSEAAYASGFDNLSYFSRTYKKLMNCLPSEAKDTDTSNASVQKPVRRQKKG